ncbi:hypothetical protein [Glaciimonas soli]|uniref:Uncharacterized protein n=1 Tax=Glaciimonas soli TaxID=2590999 RepID=A0A843YQW3_9BURK|nr:hypothetical protein [Glaciimonas soli]MQR01925.1 hypothetical protein [Glaciimonas soli]
MNTVEIEKIHAEISKLIAESGMLNAEISKINAESRWYPFVVIGGIIATTATVLADLTVLIKAFL